MPRTLALVLLLYFAAIESAVSCTCVLSKELFEDRVAEAFETATSVVFGEVEAVEAAVETDTMANGHKVSHDVQLARIKVIKSWKGGKKAGDVLRTRTTTTCCLCGLEVRVGERWLVYGYGDEPIELSICSRSAKTDLRSADIPVIERILRGEPARTVPDLKVPEPNIAFRADAPERARP
jgi:hypothetical protein